MATSFFYIYVMATSFFYIYIDIYIDIYKLTERPVVLLKAIFCWELKIKNIYDKFPFFRECWMLRDSLFAMAGYP